MCVACVGVGGLSSCFAIETVCPLLEKSVLHWDKSASKVPAKNSPCPREAAVEMKISGEVGLASVPEGEYARARVCVLWYSVAHALYNFWPTSSSVSCLFFL